MNWGAFVVEYDRQMRGMARQMLRRWTVPAAVLEDDIVQELRLGAWQALQKYDPSRKGMSPEAFALCSARLQAQRWLHGQRNSARRKGTEPGRFPAAECSLEYDLDGVIEPGQDVAVAFSERLRAALAACGSDHERAIVGVLVEEGFNVVAAAASLYGDATARRAGRYGNASQARTAVRETARRVETWLDR